MKKRTKLVALLMAMVLVMGSMTACGSKEEADTSGTTDTSDTSNTTSDDTTSADPIDVQLTVWAPQEDQKDYSDKDSKYGSSLIEYMCNAFNDAHPEWNIEFKYAVCPESDAYKELSKDAAAGADVFMYAGDQVASLVNNGIALPLLGLDEVVANNTEIAMQSVTMKDSVYGIPFTPNTWFMYYDKSKYSEEEVKSLDTMMAKDIEGCKYNFAIDADNGWYNGGFFYAAGCTVFQDEDGKENLDKCTFNDENGFAAGKAMLDLINNKKFLCDDDSQVALSNMKKGNCAAFCGGTWNAADVKKALGDNYAATKLPEITIGGKSVQLNSIGDYKYIGVNSNTQYPEVAQALAIWLGSEQCQLDHFIARGVSPTWTGLADNPDVAADVATMALQAQSAYAIVTPSDEKFGTNYWTAMEALGKGMVTKEITEKNLQEQLDKTVENIVTELDK